MKGNRLLALLAVCAAAWMPWRCWAAADSEVVRVCGQNLQNYYWNYDQTERTSTNYLWVSNYQDDTVLAGFGLMFLFPVCRSLLASFRLLLQHPDLLVQRCGIGRQPLMSLWPINHLFLWVLRCGGRCGRQQEAQEHTLLQVQ